MSLLSLGGRGFAAGAIFAAIILLALVLWIAYPSSDEATGEVPIIRADAEGYKTAPDEPGGMDIPHRDSTVFSSMGEGNPDGKVENLLSDNTTEAPMPKSDLFAGLNTDTENTPPQPMSEPVASDDMMPAQADKAKANAAASAAATAPIDSPPMQEELTEIAPAPADREASATPADITTTEPAAGVATAAPSAIANGTHFVQLASISDKAKAASAFKDLQKKYPTLANLDYRVETADLGAKGVFYRIQAGPVSKATAETTCTSVKAAAGSCLIVAK